MSDVKCKICQNKVEKSSDKFCSNHKLAKTKLQNGYELWLKAYDTLSYDDFLQQLLGLGDLVGILIKDVAEFELYFQVSK
ncbi:MAG: hypothetical protein KGD64_05290 [Candidatus Heimdallarchaeota archaeon]|nr:hypothetical protein [Candidatus Heimdallarchaeota archaeon]